MIALSNVSKAYAFQGIKKLILNQVNFCFPENKNVAVMGRNGSGKSTLMKLLAGEEEPDQGRIIRTSKVSWPLGFSGGFNGSMTGLENVRFVARIYNQDIEEILEYVAEFSELGESLKVPIKCYSSGMKARLAFGLSMAIHFDYYLIDEITSVGDSGFKDKSSKVFRENLKDSNLIIISHSISTLREYCDCGILLEEGQLTFYENIEALFSDYKKITQNPSSRNPSIPPKN